MYDIGVFIGFIAFLLAPCTVALMTRARGEEEDPADPAAEARFARSPKSRKPLAEIRGMPSRTASPLPASAPIFIAPLRRDTAFLPARAK